jgi:hypothetical protein
MKRTGNIALLVWLVVLILTTAVVYYVEQYDRPAVVDPSLFRAPDQNKIDRVVLESQDRRVTLRYDGTRWRVNDKYDADRHLIDVLFATFSKAVPKRPVSVHRLDSANAQLDTFGTTVSLFEGTTLQKKFQAGGDPAGTESWFRESNSRKVYLVAIPGYRVYVSGIFKLDEGGWRDKRIFNFNWRNFKTLEVRYPGDPSSDFVFRREGTEFTVLGIDRADTTRANAFLDDILRLSADQILLPGTSKKYDSVAATRPLVSYTVSDIAGRTITLKLFPALARDPLEAGRAFGGETVLFDRRKTFPILKKRSYFRLKQ